MATAIAETIQDQALEPRQRFILDGVSWSDYRQISDALTETHVRLTYDRGVLELMTKSSLHDILSRLYNYMLAVLAEEFDLPLLATGGMTCDREDLERGVEPDESFYLVNAAAVREKRQIDFTVDPPPDLVLEIDLSRSSRRRLSIYAAMKVPEVWMAKEDSLKVLQLRPDAAYAESDQSMYFPGIPMAEQAGFVQRRTEMDQIALLREFRRWVREHIDRSK